MSNSIDLLEANYKAIHANKSDAELQKIALANLTKVAALPSSLSERMIADANIWVTEAKACQELLTERKQAKAAKESAVKGWNANAIRRRDEAIVNLPTAVSPNGQLVAAILEDEAALSEEDILSWCDELASLSDTEGRLLLSGLVTEGVIERKKNGKYALLNICTETLYPEDPYAFALKKLLSSSISNPSGFAVLLLYISLLGSPVDSYELTKQMSQDKEMPKVAAALIERVSNDMNAIRSGSAHITDIQNELDKSPSEVWGQLRKMQETGILVVDSEIGNGRSFYFPMLGAKAN